MTQFLLTIIGVIIGVTVLGLFPVWVQVTAASLWLLWLLVELHARNCEECRVRVRHDDEEESR